MVGAGPAGSACAQILARHGLRVLLADQHDFPRDKVCGDGLIPDAHAAFARLGVSEAVQAAAHPVTHVGVVAPRGARVDVAGRLAVLPRQILDDILRRAAVDAGARWCPRVRFSRPVEDAQGRVVGARFERLRDADGQGTAPANDFDVRARWVVLATGALPQALLASGMCQRRSPSGMALRGYLSNPALAGQFTSMDVVWHRALGRGYGWIFPGRDGVFNVGVGLAHSHAQQGDGRNTMADVNLRELFETFCRVHPPARQLVASGRWVSPLKGAPLRCSLEGATLARPGLLVTGEAAGTTYAFTGEGIGKAMESGMLAAESIVQSVGSSVTQSVGQAVGQSVEHSVQNTAADTAHTHYTRTLQALKPRFDLYERAYQFNESPWMIDLLVWRAKRSPRLMRRMEGVLEERSNPGNLASWRALLKLFWSH